MQGRRLLGAVFILAAVLALAGCGGGASSQTSTVTSSSSSTSSSSFVADDSADDEATLTEQIEEAYSDVEDYVASELEAREYATPTHLALGEEAVVSSKLAVTVTSVEAGPYDPHRQTSTVKVSVRVRNLTSKVAIAKCLNFAADTTSGARKEVRKTWIRDSLFGKVARSSLLAVRVSPNSTFEGELYFDADGLSSVLYRPTLASSQNQYYYWDIQ